MSSPLPAASPTRPRDVDAWLRLLPDAFSRGITRGVVAGLVIATAVTIGLGLTVGGGQLLSPYWFAAYPVLFAAVATAVVPIAMGSGPRAAFEAFSWLGRWEVDRFKRQTRSSVPGSREAVREWLVQHPTPGFGGYARIEMLAWTGNLPGAREELAAFPAPADREDEAERIGLKLWLDLLERGTYDPVPLVEAVRRLPPGADRSRAEVNLALLDARARRADGRMDWWRPLAEIRRGLDWAPSLIVARDTLARIYVVQLMVSLVLGGALALLTAVL